MRIILCDPAQLFATGIAAALSTHNHTCTIVDSVPVPSDEPTIYVMDVPDAALLLKLVSGPQRPTILVITDRDDGFVLREAVDVGAAGLISTGSTVAEVVTAIGRLIAGQPYYDPRLLRAALPDLMSDTQAARLAAQLTPTERDVLARIVWGDSTEAMAGDLKVSTATIRSHVSQVLSKLGVHSRLSAAAFALSHNVVTGSPNRVR